VGGNSAVGLVACVAPELGGLCGAIRVVSCRRPVCRPADGRDPDGRALPGARVCFSLPGSWPRRCGSPGAGPGTPRRWRTVEFG